MKKMFRFRSVMMRIWTSFTFIILVIILSISLFYVSTFRVLDELSKQQDLSTVHDILIHSNNYSELALFEKMRNLKDVSHLVYSANEDSSVISRISASNSGTFVRISDADLDELLDHFINKNDSPARQVFSRKYNGIDFTFIISKIHDGSENIKYLVSYMPNFYDNTLIYRVIAIGGVFIIIGFVISNLVASYISSPLRELEEFTKRVASKDWKEPIKVKTEDEIGRLMHSMNEMQAALKRADEEEKLFLQSISHDLKTPVMVIMSHADAIIDGIYVDTLPKTAQIIKEEAESLSKKIKQLLYLNTLDYVLGNQTSKVSIPLHELVLDTVDRFKPVSKKIKWKLAIEEANILGNTEKITVAIENILDNAMRYAKSTIQITVRCDQEMAILEIENDGSSISPENVERIFDNFYKEKSGNFGLGLAITKKIVHFFRGKVYAQNTGDGVKFTIELPTIK